MSFTIFFHPSAQKHLTKFPNKDYEKIREKILTLQEEPRPPGVIKMKGETNSWRIRVGNYRIIYLIDDSTEEIYITSIGHRREVYR